MQILFRLIGSMILFFPIITFAHGYWIETEGSHKLKEPISIRLFYGEYSMGERMSGSFLDKMNEIKVFAKVPGGEQQSIIMRQLANYWEGTYIPQSEGAYEIIGINDEREVQDWTKHELGIVRPVQYLKTIYQVGTSNTTLSSSYSFLDIIINKISSSSYELQFFKNNTPYAIAKAVVTHPDAKETILDTDKDGKVIFNAGAPGLYLVDVEWIDKTPGQFKGKAYETVRHKFDFTLYQH